MLNQYHLPKTLTM